MALHQNIEREREKKKNEEGIKSEEFSFVREIKMENWLEEESVKMCNKMTLLGHVCIHHYVTSEYLL